MKKILSFVLVSLFVASTLLVGAPSASTATHTYPWWECEIGYASATCGGPGTTIHYDPNETIYVYARMEGGYECSWSCWHLTTHQYDSGPLQVESEYFSCTVPVDVTVNFEGDGGESYMYLDISVWTLPPNPEIRAAHIRVGLIATYSGEAPGWQEAPNPVNYYGAGEWNPCQIN